MEGVKSQRSGNKEYAAHDECQDKGSLVNIVKL